MIKEGISQLRKDAKEKFCDDTELRKQNKRLGTELEQLVTEYVDAQNLLWRLNRALYINERIMRMLREEEHSLEPGEVALIAERLLAHIRRQISKEIW